MQHSDRWQLIAVLPVRATRKNLMSWAASHWFRTWMIRPTSWQRTTADWYVQMLMQLFFLIRCCTSRPYFLHRPSIDNAFASHACRVADEGLELEKGSFCWSIFLFSLPMLLSVPFLYFQDHDTVITDHVPDIHFHHRHDHHLSSLLVSPLLFAFCLSVQLWLGSCHIPFPLLSSRHFYYYLCTRAVIITIIQRHSSFSPFTFMLMNYFEPSYANDDMFFSSFPARRLWCTSCNCFRSCFAVVPAYASPRWGLLLVPHLLHRQTWIQPQDTVSGDGKDRYTDPAGDPGHEWICFRSFDLTPTQDKWSLLWNRRIFSVHVLSGLWKIRMDGTQSVLHQRQFRQSSHRSRKVRLFFHMLSSSLFFACWSLCSRCLCVPLIQFHRMFRSVLQLSPASWLLRLMIHFHTNGRDDTVAFTPVIMSLLLQLFSFWNSYQYQIWLCLLVCASVAFAQRCLLALIPQVACFVDSA